MTDTTTDSEFVNTNIKIPKRVFIVPYRNRVQHKFFFSKYMQFILENDDNYEIYFSHQCDVRTFNRGATKNIGFLAIKNKYPNHYKDITFIFNDVDTIPFYKIFDYDTTPGVVKHYYGFKYALGGIVAIKGGDFERINGYPCFWGWGMEDNALQKRCEAHGLYIDRSIFYNIGSPEILQLFDGISRIISKKDPWRGEHDNGIDGLRTISNLAYTIDEKSANPNDNIFVVQNLNSFVINITAFNTYIPFGSEEYYNYDLREPKRKIINPDRLKETRKMVVTTNDWSNIPYYPTNREKKEQQAQQLAASGRPVPPELIRQIEMEKAKEVANDAFNANIVKPPPIPTPTVPTPTAHAVQMQRPRQIPHKFSPQYAAYIGAKPRAQSSARIGMGGTK
jgi:hypothetical protein